MTASTLTNLQNIGAVLCFVIPCLQIMFRQHDKWYKRVTWIGWVLLAVSVYIFLVSYFGNKAINKEQEQAKHDADSIRKADRDTLIKSVQEALKERNMAYNPETKTVIDTVYLSKNIVKQNSEPLVNISDDLNSATVRKDSNNHYSLIIRLQNYTTSVAYLTEVRYFVFVVVNSILYLQNGGNANLIGSKRILPSKYGITLTYPISTTILPDSTVYYIKCLYTDSSGKKQEPIRLMYSWQPNFLNRQLYEANQQEYEQVKNNLKKKNLW